MAFNLKDMCAGVLFILCALAFGGMAWMDLDMGSLLRMGPGYFPLLLSGVLFLFGAIIVFMAFFNESATEFGPVPLRGMVLILSAPIVFALTVRGLGFIPAIVLLASLASLASRQMTMLQRLLLVAGVTVFCYIVFYVGLGLPVRPIGTWLGGV